MGVVYTEINMVYFKAAVSNGVKNHEKKLRNSIRVVVHLGGMVRFFKPVAQQGIVSHKKVQWSTNVTFM